MKVNLFLAHVYALQLAARRRARVIREQERAGLGKLGGQTQTGAGDAPDPQAGTRCEYSAWQEKSKPAGAG